MTETNGHYVDPDLHRIIHGLHLELSSMASRFAEKDAQTRTMLQTIGKYIDAFVCWRDAQWRPSGSQQNQKP